MQILFTTQLSHRLINCSLPLVAQLGARLGRVGAVIGMRASTSCLDMKVGSASSSGTTVVAGAALLGGSGSASAEFAGLFVLLLPGMRRLLRDRPVGVCPRAASEFFAQNFAQAPSVLIAFSRREVRSAFVSSSAL
jgi:hypothetical protein